LIAVVGVVPYIALQLKAVSSSVELFVEAPTVPLNPTFVADIAFLVAMAMAAFAVLFGTRTVDTSEHQDGLMLAVATESVVKLVAFIIVGCFVTFIMFDGFGDLFTQAAQVGALDVITGSINGGTFIAMTLLSRVRDHPPAAPVSHPRGGEQPSCPNSAARVGCSRPTFWRSTSSSCRSRLPARCCWAGRWNRIPMCCICR
jgi:uncharacterized protein YneF (UPF0154 family)